MPRRSRRRQPLPVVYLPGALLWGAKGRSVQLSAWHGRLCSRLQGNRDAQSTRCYTRPLAVAANQCGGLTRTNKGGTPSPPVSCTAPQQAGRPGRGASPPRRTAATAAAHRALPCRPPPGRPPPDGGGCCPTPRGACHPPSRGPLLARSPELFLQGAEAIHQLLVDCRQLGAHGGLALACAAAAGAGVGVSGSRKGGAQSAGG